MSPFLFTPHSWGVFVTGKRVSVSDNKKTDAGRPPGKVVKKRKKILGKTCDRDCEVCRTPCDNPIHPPPKQK